MSLNGIVSEKINGLRKYILFNLLCIIVLFLLFYLTRYVINIDCIKNLRIIEDIEGVNYIVGFLAVLCCGIYYYVYKSNEFYIYTLSIISIYFEYVTLNTIIDNISDGSGKVYITTMFPFIFRFVILILAVFNESKVTKKIALHKKVIGCANIIITIVLIGVELYFKHIDFKMYAFIMLPGVQIILIVVYYSFLIKIGLRFLKNREYIYLIIFFSISIFNFRRLVPGNLNYNVQDYNLLYCRVIACLGFTILIIGLFIEIINSVKKNNSLNHKITTTEIEFDKIKELESLRSQFFANLSHELRTPINLIYSSVQLLEQQKEKSIDEFASYYDKYENTIKQNCFRMIRLTNNMVDITKIDAGFLKMNCKNCEIVSLVEDIALAINNHIKEKNINIIFDTTVEEIWIKCDSEKIERAILNIFSNAVKFIERSGNIMITMDADAEWVYVNIKDDGIGIPVQDRDKIFERFGQVDKSLNRAQEGCGIGLALVKSIIHMHEGEIFIKDNDGHGTEIVIKLPNFKCKECTSYSQSNNNKSDTIDSISIEFSDIYDI